MVVSAQWDGSTQQIICFRFEEAWSWLALRRKLRVGFALMRGVGHRVDMIFDLTLAHSFPNNPVVNTQLILPYLPANVGTMVFVSADEYTANILEAVYDHYKDNGVRILMVEDMEQAKALLKHERRRTTTGDR